MGREKRYSELSEYELNQEIASLRDKLEKPSRWGWSVSLPYMNEKLPWPNHIC